MSNETSGSEGREQLGVGWSGSLDLGHGHTAKFYVWAPDRDLNPQYRDLPDLRPAGITEEHPHHTTGEPCAGTVPFEVPEEHLKVFMSDKGWSEFEKKRHRWKVESLDPLTLSPSILCACGVHGFIREGRWVPA